MGTTAPEMSADGMRKCQLTGGKMSADGMRKCQLTILKKYLLEKIPSKEMLLKKHIY